MDDTLFLERSYVESGFAAVSNMLETAYGRSSFFVEFWQLFQSGRRGDIFNTARDIEGKALTANEIETCVEFYREHCPRIKLLPDSAAFINSFAGDVKTALITDGPQISQRAKILSLGLADLLNAIIVTDEHDSSWHKPGRSAFLSLEKKFGVSREQCVYIGDNPFKDFQAPLSLGWKAIRVRRPGGLHENQVCHYPEVVEVPDLFKGSVEKMGI
ncbi:HAD family hydrolase [Cryobacterium sp. Y29]|uniref:HAD family hydrolase n=1 Tax=Cryobacterium sp. Y29 TaxID=2048285 RepID=UPI001304D20C|nr:HAD family hydrolase [Cryobacterium sp. Y29]